MKRNPRIHREALSMELACALLNVSPREGGHVTIWHRLEQAKLELDAAVTQATTELGSNPLAGITAEHAMRQVGKRGFPQIKVDPDGSVMLEVHYDVPQVDAVVVEPTRKSALPTISFLRKEAGELGIDPTPFGKNKTRLINAIRDRSETSPQPQPQPQTTTTTEPLADVSTVVPKPKTLKAAPVVQPTVTLIPDDEDDVSLLFNNDPPAPQPPPPRKGTPPATITRPVQESSSSPTKKVGGRSLSDLVSKAGDEVDIDAMLAKPAPANLPED